MGIYFLIIGALFSLWVQASEIKLSRSQRTPKTTYALRSLSSVYTRAMLIEELRSFLLATGKTRYVGSENHLEISTYLKERLATLSGGVGEIREQSFLPDVAYAAAAFESNFKDQVKGLLKESDPAYKKLRAYTDQMKGAAKALKARPGKNIIWERKGSSPGAEVLILGANFDSIHIDQENLQLRPTAAAPGADDNGSGVAIALALVQILSKIELPKTVRIIFFDYGELHALGSRAYVQEHLKDKEKIAGFINLLMLGHDSSITDKKKKSGNMKLYIQKSEASGHAKDLALAQFVSEMGGEISSSVKVEIEASALPVRDNVSFWQAGIPALVFTGDWESDFNPRNHTADDFVETLNQRSLYNNYKFALAATVGWAYDIVP